MQAVEDIRVAEACQKPTGEVQGTDIRVALRHVAAQTDPTRMEFKGCNHADGGMLLLVNSDNLDVRLFGRQPRIKCRLPAPANPPFFWETGAGMTTIRVRRLRLTLIPSCLVSPVALSGSSREETALYHD